MAKESNFLFDRNVLKIIKKFNTFQSHKQALDATVYYNHLNSAKYVIDIYPCHLQHEISRLLEFACKNENKIVANILVSNNINICDVFLKLCHHAFWYSQHMIGVRFIADNFKSKIENTSSIDLTIICFLCKAPNPRYLVNNIDECIKHLTK